MALFRPGYKWKPVGSYVDAIVARSELRGWGLDREYVESALAGIRKHKNVLHPTAVKLSLGLGAGYDWAEASAWLADSLKELGNAYFDDCMDIGGVKWFHYAQNSEPENPENPELKPSYLDLDRYHFTDPKIWGVLGVREVLRSCPSWPGTDMLWLFAMNPEMFLTGWNRHSYTEFLFPGIVLTDEKSDDAAWNCGTSTGWGFIPMTEWKGPVIRFCHRSSFASANMCFVSYA